MNNKTLLVIITDRISQFIDNGSLVENYYNPGDFFDKVHILMLNDDKPDYERVQKSVGTAKLFLHNLPINKIWIMLITLGWRPALFKLFIKPAIKLAEKVKPNLIRCHGSIFAGFIAFHIKNKLKIPYVVSLHNSRYDIINDKIKNITRKTIFFLSRSIFKTGLINADMVMPVYNSIIRELKEYGVTKCKVFYNVVNVKNLKTKQDYNLHSPVRIISVGRQIAGKEPDKIILAIEKIENVVLTLVGRGEKHDALKDLVNKKNLNDKVKFIPQCSIEQICDLLYESDIFIAHNDYCGVSRAALEALLTGLPVIHSISPVGKVEEFENDIVLLVENNVEDYYNAINKLINDNEFREKLGKKALRHVQENWEPKKCEEKIVELYKSIIDKQLPIKNNLRDD